MVSPSQIYLYWNESGAPGAGVLVWEWGGRNNMYTFLLLKYYIYCTYFFCLFHRWVHSEWWWTSDDLFRECQSKQQHILSALAKREKNYFYTCWHCSKTNPKTPMFLIFWKIGWKVGLIFDRFQPKKKCPIYGDLHERAYYLPWQFCMKQSTGIPAMVYNIGLLKLWSFYWRSLNLTQKYCFDTHKRTSPKVANMSKYC